MGSGRQSIGRLQRAPKLTSTIAHEFFDARQRPRFIAQFFSPVEALAFDPRFLVSEREPLKLAFLLDRADTQPDDTTLTLRVAICADRSIVVRVLPSRRQTASDEISRSE